MRYNNWNKRRIDEKSQNQHKFFTQFKVEFYCTRGKGADEAVKWIGGNIIRAGGDSGWGEDGDNKNKDGQWK